MDFCSVSQTVLAAGSPQSSVRLRLTPPSPAPSPSPAAALGRRQPCRVQVSAPASNLLSMELVPLQPRGQGGPNGEQHSDEDQDDVRDLLEEAVDNAQHSRSRAVGSARSGNIGLMYAGILRQDTARRASNINASCVLSLVSAGGVAPARTVSQAWGIGALAPGE